MATSITTLHHVKDIDLADQGRKRIEWANQSMPVLQTIRKDLIRQQPFKGIRISACLHVTAETANLMITLRDGGAEVALCASNPLSTQDDVAAALVRDYNIQTYAIKGEEDDGYQAHLLAALEHKPHLTIDDGCDLIQLLHTKQQDILDGVIAGTEETTTGAMRLRAMAKSDLLRYPVIAVNDALTKQLFDNRYGTGQSTLDGILRCTNVLLAGAKVVVAGYGWCGRGVAVRARGMGADVIVTEIDPVKAVEAVMDGFRVMSMVEAAKLGNVFVTATGNKNVLRQEHFDAMKNGAIVANAGHLNVEIDMAALKRMASLKKATREFVDEYALRDGRKIYLLGEGRLINFAAAEGHPASIMDISFANQALSAEYLVKNHANLERKVYSVPQELDKRVARLKLEAMSIGIDRLTQEQESYQANWAEGA